MYLDGTTRRGFSRVIHAHETKHVTQQVGTEDTDSGAAMRAMAKELKEKQTSHVEHRPMQTRGPQRAIDSFVVAIARRRGHFLLRTIRRETEKNILMHAVQYIESQKRGEGGKPSTAISLQRAPVAECSTETMALFTCSVELDDGPETRERGVRTRFGDSGNRWG